MLSQIPEDELQEELQRRAKKKKEDDEFFAQIPKPVENPDFRKLIEVCNQAVQNVAKDRIGGYPGKDHDHYIYEIAMTTIFGEGFWTWWNKFSHY